VTQGGGSKQREDQTHNYRNPLLLREHLQREGIVPEPGNTQRLLSLSTLDDLPVPIPVMFPGSKMRMAIIKPVDDRMFEEIRTHLQKDANSNSNSTSTEDEAEKRMWESHERRQYNEILKAFHRYEDMDVQTMDVKTSLLCAIQEGVIHRVRAVLERDGVDVNLKRSRVVSVDVSELAVATPTLFSSC
jgi:hypothetical protein